MLVTEHGLALIVVAAAIAGVLLVASRLPSRWTDQGARVIAVAVVVAEMCWWGLSLAEHRWSVRYGLPLHLCEAGCFVVAAALWWRTPFAFEVSYFWGLGGTLPGLFTPSIPGHFPQPIYFQYYVEHGLLVLGALYLVVILRMRPARHAVLRVSGATALYAIAVGFVDYVTDGNYLFLRNLPPTGTLLDYMGPWPWYLVTLTVLAVAMFTLLYLPFARRSSSRTPAESAA